MDGWMDVCPTRARCSVLPGWAGRSALQAGQAAEWGTEVGSQWELWRFPLDTVSGTVATRCSGWQLSVKASDGDICFSWSSRARDSEVLRGLQPGPWVWWSWVQYSCSRGSSISSDWVQQRAEGFVSFQVLDIYPLLCVRASVTSKTSFSRVLKAWYVFHLLVLLRLGPHPAPSQAGCRIPEIRALCWAGGDCFFCAPASTAVPKRCQAVPHFSKWSVQIRD